MKIKIISLSQPVVKAIKKEVWQVVKEWETVIKIGKDVMKIIVKPGFRYDGASIPRIAWSLIGVHPGGIALAPALSHDILYIAEGGKKKVKKVSIVSKNCSRKIADRIIYQSFRKVGVKKRRAVFMYMAVRMGGKKYWGTKKQIPVSK